MTAIKARISVADDHSISGIAPSDVPPGEHEVAFTVTSVVTPQSEIPKFFRAADLPVHDLPWDGSVSLRREDMYGDDGR